MLCSAIIRLARAYIHPPIFTGSSQIFYCFGRVGAERNSAPAVGPSMTGTWPT